MATAKQLPSGRWRVLLYDGKDDTGKRVYKSFDGDTAVEAEAAANDYALERNRKRQLRKMADALAAGDKIGRREHSMLARMLDLTDIGDETRPEPKKLSDLCSRYIDERSHILSPSTQREYRQIIKRHYIMDMYVDEITPSIIQIWVDQYAAKVSGKTVLNAYFFVEAALEAYAPDIDLRKINLPQKKKPKLYTPSDADVSKLLQAAAGTELEKAILLAAFGPLRRSEICALDASDIEEDVVTISKAIVHNEHNQWVKKDFAKTEGSQRSIEFPDWVIKKLPKEGTICNFTNPDSISKQFRQLLLQNDIPKFRFHDLRAYAASIMHAIGIQDKYIMARGGWVSREVLDNVYKRTIDDVTKQKNQEIFAHFETVVVKDPQE